MEETKTAVAAAAADPRPQHCTIDALSSVTYRYIICGGNAKKGRYGPPDPT